MFTPERVTDLTNLIYSYLPTRGGYRIGVIFSDWVGSYSNMEVSMAMERLEEDGKIAMAKGNFIQVA